MNGGSKAIPARSPSRGARAAPERDSATRRPHGRGAQSFPIFNLIVFVFERERGAAVSCWRLLIIHKQERVRTLGCRPPAVLRNRHIERLEAQAGAVHMRVLRTLVGPAAIVSQSRLPNRVSNMQHPHTKYFLP
jgi:hypothetical protein